MKSLACAEMTPRELEAEITRLLKSGLDDRSLRNELDTLAEKEPSFPGFTWFWGPILYLRNRTLFRPFIMSRFSRWMLLPKRKVQVIGYRKHADRLDPWLEEADRSDDVELFRRLYEWKLDGLYSWRKRGLRSEEICSELRRRFAKATTLTQRQVVLRKFDLWFLLDEATAVALYQTEPNAAGPFILRHLPNEWYLGDKGRVLWEKLFRAARERNDDFGWKLYQRQVPQKRWERDVAQVAMDVRDPAILCAELKKRHLQGGWGVDLTGGMLALLERRGREVFPYVTQHLGSVRRGFWFRTGDYKALIKLAEGREWWDLWSGLMRVAGKRAEFSAAVKRWVTSNLPEPVKRERLLALAGVSRAWNLPGLGIASTHQLEEDAALLLYDRHPDLVHGPFRQHIQGHRWGEAFPKLLDRFLANADEEMIDLAASRAATSFGRWGSAPKQIDLASKLADYYLGLKSDETDFARRAARVLGLIPAFSIFNYATLIRENRLARLLFERSLSSFLSSKQGLIDLVEASEIHVQELAYRALGQNDPRAQEVGREQLPLLLGTLLRPLQRATRRAAFGALANTARDLDSARMIVERAREAFILPDEKYPKEQLVGLIAKILHRWPELRGVKEQPVIYERIAA
jgi:hypothetical protein